MTQSGDTHIQVAQLSFNNKGKAGQITAFAYSGPMDYQDISDFTSILTNPAHQALEPKPDPHIKQLLLENQRLSEQIQQLQRASYLTKRQLLDSLETLRDENQQIKNRLASLIDTVKDLQT